MLCGGTNYEVSAEAERLKDWHKLVSGDNNYTQLILSTPAVLPTQFLHELISKYCFLKTWCNHVVLGRRCLTSDSTTLRYCLLYPYDYTRSDRNYSQHILISLLWLLNNLLSKQNKTIYEYVPISCSNNIAFQAKSCESLSLQAKPSVLN